MIVVASIVLGAVFVVAGVMKVAAPQQWRVQSTGLGVPRVVAAAVPFVELTIGALLIAQLARRPVALIAAVLLAVFTTLLVVRLQQGRRPPCACFGGWSNRPISWSNVARNAAFVVLAVAVALG